MAAVAAPLAPATIPTSAGTTPKKKPAPRPPKPSARPGLFLLSNYLSACDLSTALARLIPAVVCGDVKPRTAHTVAYLMQTLMPATHMSKHEYINAFGTEGWRQAVYNSVNDNYDYRFPPAPKPKQPAPSAAPTNPQRAPSTFRTNLRSDSPQPQTQPAQPP